MSPDRKRSFLLWLLLVILVACIVGFVFLAAAYLSQGKNQPTEKPPETTSQSERPPENWAGTYYYAGMPRTTAAFPDRITVLTNQGYVVGYCETRKDPAWVCYRLCRVGNLQAPPRPQGFTVDVRTQARINQHDYSGSGYDRGHMAPNYAIAVCDGAQAQLETFMMSNIVPQKPNLNRRVWERLEQVEVKDYAQRFTRVWVIDGPVFDANPPTLRSGVAVPKACYKIIVEEEHGRPKMLAFVMPQNVMGTESPSEFLTSVEEIQRETGLDFFTELPAEMQSKMEHERVAGMW